MIFWSPEDGPFKIHDRDLAVGTAFQCLHEFGGDERAGIALPLQRELIHIHGIRHVHRQDEFDIDGRQVPLHQTKVRPGMRALAGSGRYRYRTRGDQSQKWEL